MEKGGEGRMTRCWSRYVIFCIRLCRTSCSNEGASQPSHPFFRAVLEKSSRRYLRMRSLMRGKLSGFLFKLIYKLTFYRVNRSRATRFWFDDPNDEGFML